VNSKNHGFKIYGTENKTIDLSHVRFLEVMIIVKSLLYVETFSKAFYACTFRQAARLQVSVPSSRCSAGAVFVVFVF